MSDRIFYEIYNIFTKESAVLPIEKGADKTTIAGLFSKQYGRKGWVLVKPLSHKGGKK